MNGYCWRQDTWDQAGCNSGYSREFNYGCSGYCKGNKGFYSGYCCKIQNGYCYREAPKFKVVGEWISRGIASGRAGKFSYSKTTGVENTVTQG